MGHRWPRQRCARDSLKETCEPVQLGQDTSGGTQAPGLIMGLHMDRGPGETAVKVDFRSALNSIERAAIIRKLALRPALAHLLRNFDRRCAPCPRFSTSQLTASLSRHTAIARMDAGIWRLRGPVLLSARKRALRGLFSTASSQQGQPTQYGRPSPLSSRVRVSASAWHPRRLKPRCGLQVGSAAANLLRSGSVCSSAGRRGRPVSGSFQAVWL